MVVFLVSKQQIERSFDVIYKYNYFGSLLISKQQIERSFDVVYKYKFDSFLVSKQQIVQFAWPYI